MEHYHDHDHPEKGSDPGFGEKAAKLVQHWIHHNSEHAAGYHKWAAEFRHHGMVEAARALETAAEASVRIDQALREAAAKIDAGKP